MLKNILLIIFSIFFSKAVAQDKELLIDTVFVKSFSSEKIIKTIKESKKQYKKYFIDSGVYTAELSLTADHETVSDLTSSHFTFGDLKKKKYQKNTRQSFYKDVKIFEFNPDLPDYTLYHLCHFPDFDYLNYFKNYKYKMREIDDVLQITCYSKSTNLKAVIILDKKTLLPKAVYKNSIAPTYNVSQTYDNMIKNTDSETMYDLVKDEATILYQIENNAITIAEIHADLIMDHYRIQRNNKKGDLIFSKKLRNVVSKIRIKNND